jgi:hypothetical protein
MFIDSQFVYLRFLNCISHMVLSLNWCGLWLTNWEARPWSVLTIGTSAIYFPYSLTSHVSGQRTPQFRYWGNNYMLCVMGYRTTQEAMRDKYAAMVEWWSVWETGGIRKNPRSSSSATDLNIKSPGKDPRSMTRGQPLIDWAVIRPSRHYLNQINSKVIIYNGSKNRVHILWKQNVRVDNLMTKWSVPYITRILNSYRRS